MNQGMLGAGGTPDMETTPAWFRSSRLGDPAALEEILAPLRQVRDYMRIVDPIAQGIATVAQVEALVVSVFQALSTPRVLGIALSEMLTRFLEKYLTDGGYFIQHGNLGEIIARSGVAPLLEDVQQYLREEDMQRAAAQAGERSLYLQFGPDADAQGGPWQAYRQFPALIQTQLDIRARQAVVSALDAFQTAPFDAFEDWLMPILAAFSDPGDPFRPRAGESDKLGGILFAVQGQDPLAVYDAVQKLRQLLFDTVPKELDFTSVWDDLYENLGLDTISQWELTNVAGLGGLRSGLRPHLLPRYSSSPDFFRASTADLLPFLSDLLLDLTDLAHFAGLPFPENFSLLKIAEALAKKIRALLKVLDAVIDVLTKLAGLLELSNVWRLFLPAETGGVSGLVERIRSAPRDDTVRLTWGTLTKSSSSQAGITLQEFAYGRITSLPDDTSGVPEYQDQQVGDWMESSALDALLLAFTNAGRPGFAWDNEKVWRAGDTLRRSHALALQRAFPQVGFGPPGDLLIWGMGLFFVQGPLFRLLEALFAPQEADWQEWFEGGAPATTSVADFVSTTNLAPLPPSAPIPATGIVLPDASSVGIAAAGADQIDTSPLAQLQDALIALTPSDTSARVHRFGCSRSYMPSQGCIQQVSGSDALHIFHPDHPPLLSLGDASSPLGHEAQWLTDRLLPRVGPLPMPHSPDEHPSHLGLTGQGFVVQDPAALGVAPVSSTAFSGVLGPGGTWIEDAAFVAALFAAGFGSHNDQALWCLDVAVTWRQAGTVRLRSLVLALDLLANRAYIEPALPTPPLIASSNVSGLWHLSQEPLLRIYPPLQHPSTQIAQAPAASFALCAMLRKTLRASDPARAQGAGMSLMGCACGHIVDVDEHPWGDCEQVVLSGDTAPFTVVSGADNEQIRHIYPEQGIDLLAGLSGVLATASTLSSTTLQASASLAQISRAEGTVSVLRDIGGSGVFVPLWGSAGLRDHFKAVGVNVPRRSLLWVGLVTDVGYLFASPDLWQDVVVSVDGVELVSVGLASLAGGAPPDPLTGDSGHPGRKSWPVVLDGLVQIEHAGKYFAVVVEAGLFEKRGDEGTYDVQYPSALFSPWVRHHSSADDALLPGDQILLSDGPWVRAGASPAWTTSFGGADPCQGHGQLQVHIPRSAQLGLRPAIATRGAALWLWLACTMDSHCWEQGLYLLLCGASHRVTLLVDSVQLTLGVEQRDVAARAWVQIASLVVPHVARSQQYVLVLQSVPALPRLDLLWSQRILGVWQQQGFESQALQARALCGRKEGGGTFVVGYNGQQPPVSERLCALPWELTDFRPGPSGLALVELGFDQVSSSDPDVVLDLYR